MKRETEYAKKAARMIPCLENIFCQHFKKHALPCSGYFHTFSETGASEFSEIPSVKKLEDRNNRDV